MAIFYTLKQSIPNLLPNSSNRSRLWQIWSLHAKNCNWIL